MQCFRLLILFLTLVAYSCESLVTDVNPGSLHDIESKLVVQSFISPQNNRITVVVTESTPVFGEYSVSFNIIRDAVVKISDGNREVSMIYDSTGSSYSIDRLRMNIVPGKTYQLSVSDGTRSVKSSCTVPMGSPVITSYEIDTVFSSNALYPDTAITVKMTWEDTRGVPNFYRVRSFLELEYTILEGSDPENFKERRVRNRFNVDWNREAGFSDYQNDVNRDGAIFTSSTGRFALPTPFVYALPDGEVRTLHPRSKIISLTFQVDNTDEGYFRYHRSLQLRNTDNPFSEPALIYSNITDGLGCFAAYNSSSKVYRPVR
jgi:hypothetical protein